MLTLMLAAAPAHGQIAAIRNALGLPNNVGTPAAQGAFSAPPVTPTMGQILARQANYQARVVQQAGLVAQANAAARAAAQAATQTVRDGLGAGGLDRVPVDQSLVSVADKTGLSVWQGAATPTQTANAAGGFDVTINQDQSRALLSWKTFDVGKNTNLTFNQQGHSDWVVVNRVVGGINPATGLVDPALAPAPSQILGSIKADGSVYVLNRSGVIFGATSQINLHSLLASTLELGAGTIPVGTNNSLRDLSLQERNNAYLQNGLLPGSPAGLVASVTGETHGAVTVAQGARINGTGYVILAAPTVSSAGEIKVAAGGQVSLEAGTQIDAYASTGAADSIDPNVRGLVLASSGGGTVDVSGSIDAPQGYVSLGTSVAGSVKLSGIVTATTSVSRNAKISMIGGTVDLAPNAVISITPDTAADTIPLSADFKTSQIDIGSHYSVLSGATGRLEGSADPAVGINDLRPALITLDTNSLIHAPSASVNIGGTAGGTPPSLDESLVTLSKLQSKIDIKDNAVIDVSGIADYLLSAARNELEISPAKRNELRDTPLYRDEATGSTFTLNGKTLYVDPRLSGVRDDGVAWIGSPLIEAGSLAAQIGVTASERMTKGGNVTLATITAPKDLAAGVTIPGISIASSASIDVAGGWVRYQDGFIRSSKLLTADGAIVDIAQADPNGDYVAVGGGFVEQLPQLSNPTVFASPLQGPGTFVAGYVEGRDAGSLTIKAPMVSLNGTVHGDAVAGSRQIADAQVASGKSTIAGDIRKLQAAGGQLPSGGLLHIQSVQGADMVIAAAGETAADNVVRLDAGMLDAAGLSGISLQTSGAVTTTAASALNLAAGGAFNVEAGRTITFNGDISAPAGSITARTFFSQLGSVFTADDDYPLAGFLGSSGAPSLLNFDIVVNQGATLSARGLWTNDSLVTEGLLGGSAYTSGGTISFNVAPHVIAATDSSFTRAVDLSGSVLVKSGSLLDVSGGGYVSSTGALSLSGKGGNVSLVNETVYFRLENSDRNELAPLTGIDLFGSSLPTFQLTPGLYSSALIPDAIKSRIDLADGTVKAFGFKGGGTFTLVTPDLDFGSSGGSGTAIPLDFLQKTGFGTLDLTSWNTAIVNDVFSSRTGASALLATERVKINAGETLNLTQSILPSILTADQIVGLRALASGKDVIADGGLRPSSTLGDYDNLAANLVLGGATELELLGGTITGAAGATITTPRLYNDGTIKIVGGTITQRQILPLAYVSPRTAIGVSVVDDSEAARLAGLSAVFGAADGDGRYSETDATRDFLGKFNADHQLYYLGLLGADEGIRLTGRSTTDLSGASIRNPRALLLRDGTTSVTGRLVNGGTIQALGTLLDGGSLFTQSLAGATAYKDRSSDFEPKGARIALRLDADAGAVIDLAGASDTYDIQTGAATLTRSAVWSNAGTLSALGGGDIAGAVIDAHGGAAQATGGTIEWFNPVLRQLDPADALTDGLSANQIMAAGFDSLIARGQLTTDGAVDLALNRSFLLRAPDFAGKTVQSNYYAISLASTGNLKITAPHVGLLSIDQNAASLPLAAAKDAGAFDLDLSAKAIDIAGAVTFGDAFRKVTLDSAGDIRLIGVQPIELTLDPNAIVNPSLSGGVIVAGDLLMRASQVYATTGTGNLQQLAESAVATPRPFVIASIGGTNYGGATVGNPKTTIRFERSTDTVPATPYSAGSYISILAPNIEQAGILRAPLGRIDLGSREGASVPLTGSRTVKTDNLTLAAGSVTSVSAAGMLIPYGTTTDLTEYYFTPTVQSPLTAPPAAELRLAGGTITTAPDAIVDGKGGGDLYAYEFVSGTGGSRDVLSRFNSDSFSSRNGFQYADGRQVYAILPSGSSANALFDPLYSADYAALYGADVGKTVRLDASSGLPAGDYVLLPAQYALLPGAVRIVENVGATAPLANAAATLADGSVVVGGVYGVSGTNLIEWQRRSFTIQTQDVFRKYSQINSTSATTDFTKLADHKGIVLPRMPNDAARVVIDPATGLTIGGRFDTVAAEGGRGSQVDISGSMIDIVSPDGKARTGYVSLQTDDIANLNAASLLIGGVRTDKTDGSTDIRVTAHEIRVANDAANPLSAPEIILAVDGIKSLMTVADGASIIATGTLADTRSGDYNVAYYTEDSSGNITADNNGAGAVLRVANGVERLVNRSGALADKTTRKNSKFNIGAATIQGDALALDTSRNIVVNSKAQLDAKFIALSSDSLAFSSRNISGFDISPELELVLGAAERLTLRSSRSIGFTPGSHAFNDLKIDAPGVRLVPGARRETDPQTVTIKAREVSFTNSNKDKGDCTRKGAFACNANGNSLVVEATSLRFGSGNFRTTYGFDKAVSLTASAGAYFEGTSTFDVGSAALSLTTPFLVDRGTAAIPKEGAEQASLDLLTKGTVTISAPAGSTAAPTTPLSPGARLAIGSLVNPAQRISIDGTMLRATAGTIDLNARGDIAVTGNAVLAAQSYRQSFGDAADAVVVSAGGGNIGLTSKTGNIDIASTARISIGGATGKAGTLSLLAAEGQVNLSLDGTIDAAAPDRQASLAFDSLNGSFDFAKFARQYGSAFTGDVVIRTGVGNLALDAGQSLKLASLNLTSDGGTTTIAGTVNTSGINGGDISLYGRDGVNLAGSAILDAHSDGYADTDTRQAKAGDIILGVGQGGAINVAAGAAIDLTARRAGNRLVPHQQTDPATLTQVTAYTFVEADQGGTLTLRAPVVTRQGADTVDIGFAGTVSGARDVTVEGYRRTDLADFAAGGSKAGYSGVEVKDGTATLSLLTAPGTTNFLADKGAGTIVDFIQNFDISAARANLGSLTSLSTYHERAGVQLDYAGNIVLASNWNLGAGTVDVAAALAGPDPDMRISALTTDPANPRYEVIPGHEAHLFQNYVDFLYRVGGKGDGTGKNGEAAVGFYKAGNLTLRAGGNLDIKHSITDGFFSFGDQTDADFINYQLGGGTRTYHPAIDIKCGREGCSNVDAYTPDTTKPIELPPGKSAIDLSFGGISRGEQTFNSAAPYSAAANSAAATSADGVVGHGNAIGSSAIFPLLADGSGADSFSIQLVGGAGSASSANALHVDRGSNGSVTVSGESTYELTSTKPVGQYDGALQLKYPGLDSLLTQDIFDGFAAASNISTDTLSDRITRVNFGHSSPAAVAFLREEAAKFFGGLPLDQVQFTGPAGAPNGFAAPFALVAQFLESKDATGRTLLERFGALVADGSFGIDAPLGGGGRTNPQKVIHAPSLVRTGTGSIDVAAARNVDLTNGAAAFRSSTGRITKRATSNNAQAGGTAIYTVGHVVVPTAVTARVVGTNQQFTIDPSQYAVTDNLLENAVKPSLTGALLTNPVYATGGGSISIKAGNDVLGRRDVWSEAFNSNQNQVASASSDGVFFGTDVIGTADQRWRVGLMGLAEPVAGTTITTALATNIRVNAQMFSSGVGTLGGGDVAIAAGGNVRELTVALDTTVTTGNVGDSFGSMVFGGGNLSIAAGKNVAGGRFDISTGVANIKAGMAIGSSGKLTLVPTRGEKLASVQTANLPEIRVTDAVVTLSAGGSVELGKVTALGVDSSDGNAFDRQVDQNALGYYTGTSGIVVMASGNVSLLDGPAYNGATQQLSKLLPATLDITSFQGNIDLGAKNSILYPGATGQLSLLAGGTLASAAIDLDDGDASLLPGIFSAVRYGTAGVKTFGRDLNDLPVITPTTSDATRRLYHNSTPTHAGDGKAARIAVGGDLVDLTLFLSKQGRVSAGGSIQNMIFNGQNIASTDVTRIVAGKDITATTTLVTSDAALKGRSIVQGNQFIIGGPGAFYLEAGRDMGPFLTSATVGKVSYAGGILAVGNDYNPWLAPKSADIYAFFGVAKGINFSGLRDTYVDPANAAALDGDLFEQNSDSFGNKTPDRTRPIYSAILVDWMKTNASDALIAAFGTTDVTAAQAYTVFKAMPDLNQRRFLLDQVYFNELAAPSRPDGNSYLQYVRGYKAVDTLFPAGLGYTANDLSGASNGGTKVATGNLDLRLAAIETTRGSNITILGPGGNAVLGSVVRTSEQAQRRAYQAAVFQGYQSGTFRPTIDRNPAAVSAIPIGYEGVLTLRGGAIHGFTDADFRLNQSRLFAQKSGDIVLWSSNGDLNAGQGPKSAANVPPIVVRFDPNGATEVDSAAGVVGAGIAGFAAINRLNVSTGSFDQIDVLNDPDVAVAEAQLLNLPRGAQVVVNGKTYSRSVPTITLIAPAGTVDAGDAGVRASGDIFVAAAQVANADNFKVGGTAIGVPSLANTTAPAVPANAASAVTANVFRASQADNSDQKSRITVDVLGYYSGDTDCKDANGNPTKDCPR